MIGAQEVDQVVRVVSDEGGTDPIWLAIAGLIIAPVASFITALYARRSEVGQLVKEHERALDVVKAQLSHQAANANLGGLVKRIGALRDAASGLTTAVTEVGSSVYFQTAQKEPQRRVSMLPQSALA